MPKTSAQRDLDQERQAETRDHAERIVTVNEQYDTSTFSVRNWVELEAECNRQHKFAVERQPVIDTAREQCGYIMRRTSNTAVHAALNTILRTLETQPGATP